MHRHATVRLRQRVTKGPGSSRAGIAMAYKLIEAAQARWRKVNAPELVALVRAGAIFHKGKLLERPTDITPDLMPPHDDTADRRSTETHQSTAGLGDFRNQICDAERVACRVDQHTPVVRVGLNIGFCGAQREYSGFLAIKVRDRQFEVELFGHCAFRPGRWRVIGDSLKREEDSCTLQGHELVGGEHHLEVQNVLVELSQRGGVWAID
jgi:hypothetical protein